MEILTIIKNHVNFNFIKWLKCGGEDEHDSDVMVMMWSCEFNLQQPLNSQQRFSKSAFDDY